MRTAVVTISNCPSCGSSRHQEFVILEQEGREIWRWPSDVYCPSRCSADEVRRAEREVRL